MDLKSQLNDRLSKAFAAFMAAEGVEDAPAVRADVEEPRNREHGDYASNVAMQLARTLKRSPMDIAEGFLKHFDGEGLVSEVSVLKPGFINFRMATDATAGVLRRIAEEGDGYGRTATGAGTRVLIEFVSANPTGPLHIGHARNAVVGDVVGRLYEAAGYEIVREYYFNDAGVQMRMLGESLRYRVERELGRAVEEPEEYYRGEYMIDIARLMIEEIGAEKAGGENDVQFYTDFAAREVLKTIDADLKSMGIPFDNWFSEQSLYDKGEVEDTLGELRARDMIYEKDGAVWLRSESRGDVRDRVVVKSDGTYTYLMPDIAYNQDKFSRGFDRIVNVLGADHMGQVPSLLIAAEALGHPKDALLYTLYQMVTFEKDGAAMKLSTRSGEFVTLREMIEELGVGVVRYFFAMRSPNAQMVFDWDLAKDTSMNNPVYYVQYAYARCCSLMRKAEETGQAYGGIEGADLSLLVDEDEKAMLRALGRLPEVVDSGAAELAPQHLTNYLRELAAVFHGWFTRGTNDPQLRVLQADNPALSQARLALVDGLRTTLANALGILGIEPMERM